MQQDIRLVIDPDFEGRLDPLAPEEEALLEQSLVDDGCLDPLKVWNGILIDGHNRKRLCEKHGIPYKVAKVDFDSREDALDWVDRQQLGRRNLTRDQFLILIGRIYNRRKNGRGGDRKSKCQNDTLIDTADSVASEYAISPATVKRAGKLAAAVDNDAALKEAVRAKVPLKQVISGRKKEKREADLARQREAIESGKVELPSGLFEVVVMDPPWAYGREFDPDGSRVANPYPEMTQGQLLELQPPFAKDCVLFLWTTHSFIFDAKALLDRWGFTYKATMVWDKQSLGMGAWLRMQCEFCLIGVRGRPTWSNTTWRDIISERRREHSRKPDAFYKMVEDVTVGRRLDYFSREQREGWESFGNETKKFDSGSGATKRKPSVKAAGQPRDRALREMENAISARLNQPKPLNS